MEFAIWLLVGLIVGGAIGAVATWWISRARGGVVSVMQLKQENDKFRDEVAEHFVETARLINHMSESYKQVFDHLSRGAEKLVDDEKLAERLPPATGQEVRLSHFGASASAAASGEKAGAGSSAKDRTSDRNDDTRHESESDHNSQAGNFRSGDTENGAGKDPLKTGSSETGDKDKASGPSDADRSGHREKGKDGGTDSGGGDESRKPDDSAVNSASGSNQAGEGSRTKD